eukprot:GHVT01015404.1.p1 GENE.GHVT01015404.1~~GHVT01015404.1.p1  ORF type:complete len:632 (+),score=136.46 GHVT01015404.1:144-2039(+)
MQSSAAASGAGVLTPPPAASLGVMMPVEDPAALRPLGLPTDWSLNARTMCDLEMLLSGAFAPLDGFMGFADYKRCLDEMRLAAGPIFPIPVVLAIPKEAAHPNLHWLDSAPPQPEDLTPTSTAQGDKPVIRLRDKVGTVVAILEVSSVFEPDLEKEAQAVLGTTDRNHPYVDYLFSNMKNCYYVGGKVVPKNAIQHFDFAEYRKSAQEVRASLKRLGWDVVVGFQTRNPLHRSHFELTKQAVREATETSGRGARLLLTPAVGPTQPGDVDYYIRVRCYKRILKYWGADNVQMALLPLAMRMAGPREAVWHAIIRKNYGCTHFIVGRDHAGPSSRQANGDPFYTPYAAHELLRSVQDELGITPVFGKEMVYLGEGPSQGFMQVDQVPKNAVPQVISGTELRNRLTDRTPIPDWFSFPEVVEELHKFYKPQHEMGLCIYFTGLPCSGKSTLAGAVEASLNESMFEERKITMFDADVIRQHLSKGLGFSKEDRALNVRRIGYVCSEVVKHGGICCVANIAPYMADRKFNRDAVKAAGGNYVEVFVSTPLSVCEQRDVKELYKKARQGTVKCFTGISDPYEKPEDAEVTVDCTGDLRESVAKVLKFLKDSKFILRQKKEEERADSTPSSKATIQA